MIEGEPSSGFGDDEQVVQCLQHVRVLLFTLIFSMSIFASLLLQFFTLLI
jgi:hypothetical protein